MKDYTRGCIVRLLMDITEVNDDPYQETVVVGRRGDIGTVTSSQGLLAFNVQLLSGQSLSLIQMDLFEEVSPLEQLAMVAD